MADQALSILARFDPAERLVEAAECFALALKKRKVDVLLGSSLGDLADVTNLGRPAGAPVAPAVLHVLQYQAAPVFEQLPQLCASRVRHAPTSSVTQHATSLTGCLSCLEHRFWSANRLMSA
jgi:hypothetical protein